MESAFRDDAAIPRLRAVGDVQGSGLLASEYSCRRSVQSDRTRGMVPIAPLV